MASMLPVRRSRPLLAACLLLGLCASSAAQPTAPASAGPPDPKLIEDLVAANRILAD